MLLDVRVGIYDTRHMEHLHEYIKAQAEQTDSKLAERFGISRSHFTMLRLGTALPSRKLAAHIEAVTEGAIPRSAWDTDDGQPPNAKPKVSA